MMETHIGVVIIGRNEGERLKQCFKSVIKNTDRIVYVDSGSSDSSVELAESFNITVVQLDMSVPFSAARARNQGFEKLMFENKNTELVQFVDGDCEVIAGWLNIAAEKLLISPDIVLVCGRRHEKYPNKSIFNYLCDIEWDTPVGYTKASGGDFMIRTKAFIEVNGFNPIVVAGEEPELCFRLRQKKWKIWRIAASMTIHDAAITEVSSWWKRTKRSGYAYAFGYYLHGGSKEKHCRKVSLRIWIWALFLPLIILVLGSFNLFFFLLFLIYPFQILRIMKNIQHKVKSKRIAFYYGFFNVLGKWPELMGQIRFYWNFFLDRSHRIIEYKKSS